MGCKKRDIAEGRRAWGDKTGLRGSGAKIGRHENGEALPPRIMSLFREGDTQAIIS